MRWIIIFSIVLVASVVYAQTPATTQAASERPPMNVLLLRFDQLDQQAGMQWVGRAVQQSLLAEAVRLRMVQAITPKEETLTNHSTTDQSVAQEMGKESGADYVVFGSYQTLDKELRLTGSILDVSSGKIIGGLKATGAVRDLFGLQDQMAEQMKRQLVNLYAPLATQPSQPAMANVAPPSAPPTVLSTPVPNSGSFEGSSLQRSLRYKGSLYETFKSDRNQNAQRNYYYSYPNSYYYGGYGGYSFTPWWGGYTYRGHLPASINRALTPTGLSGN